MPSTSPSSRRRNASPSPSNETGASSSTDAADTAAAPSPGEENRRKLDYLAATPIEEWPQWLFSDAADVLNRRHKRLGNINPEDGGIGAADGSLPHDIAHDIDDDTDALAVAAAILRVDILQNYANHIEATHLEKVEEGCAPMSFDSLYARHMNRFQQEKFDLWKTACKDVFVFCRKNGVVMTPGCHGWEDIYVLHKHLQLKKNNAYIYLLLQIFKTGNCGRGGLRIEEYAKLFEKGLLDYMPTIVPQIDIDNLPVDFQRKLTALILKKIAPFTFTRANAPQSLEDALELDMIGLPIGLQELIHSVITPRRPIWRWDSGG